jgi:hypothetical protein
VHFLRLLIRASTELERWLRCEARQSRCGGIEYNATREHPASPYRQGRSAYRVEGFDDRQKPTAFGELGVDVRHRLGDRSTEQNYIVRSTRPISLVQWTFDDTDRGDSVLDESNTRMPGQFGILF